MEIEAHTRLQLRVDRMLGKEPRNCQPPSVSVAKEKEQDQPLKGSEIEETQVSLEERRSDLWLLNQRSLAN